MAAKIELSPDEPSAVSRPPPRRMTLRWSGSQGDGDGADGTDAMELEELVERVAYCEEDYVIDIDVSHNQNVNDKLMFAFKNHFDHVNHQPPSALTSVNVSHTMITPDARLVLQPWLTQQGGALHCLRLGGCPGLMDSDGDSESVGAGEDRGVADGPKTTGGSFYFWRSLAESLAHAHCRLRELDLGGAGLSPTSLGLILFDGVAHCPCLEVLRVDLSGWTQRDMATRRGAKAKSSPSSSSSLRILLNTADQPQMNDVPHFLEAVAAHDCHRRLLDVTLSGIQDVAAALAALRVCPCEQLATALVSLSLSGPHPRATSVAATSETVLAFQFPELRHLAVNISDSSATTSSSSGGTTMNPRESSPYRTCKELLAWLGGAHKLEVVECSRMSFNNGGGESDEDATIVRRLFTRLGDLTVGGHLKSLALRACCLSAAALECFLLPVFGAAVATTTSSLQFLNLNRSVVMGRDKKGAALVADAAARVGLLQGLFSLLLRLPRLKQLSVRGSYWWNGRMSSAAAVPSSLVALVTGAEGTSSSRSSIAEEEADRIAECLREAICRRHDMRLLIAGAVPSADQKAETEAPFLPTVVLWAPLATVESEKRISDGMTRRLDAALQRSYKPLTLWI